MKTIYLYIVRCQDGSYYIGLTNDLERRLFEHNSGFDPKSYTFQRRPVTLVYCDTFNDPLQAIEREKQIKGWSRRKKEALIACNWKTLKRFSACENETSHLNHRKPFDSAQDDEDSAQDNKEHA